MTLNSDSGWLQYFNLLNRKFTETKNKQKHNGVKWCHKWNVPADITENFTQTQKNVCSVSHGTFEK